jgi:hypothetical protein
MVAMNSNKSSYTLHRFNPLRLFYPKGEPDRVLEAAAVEACSLPPPTMSFHPVQLLHKRETMEFMLFGRDRDKIVCTDETGRAVLYDDGSHAVRMLPSLRAPKWLSVPLSVGDSLFVMEANPTNDQENGKQSVEALMYGKRPTMFKGEDFFWQSIPPPPYVYAPGYGSDRSGMITARTVVGGSGIWISTESLGTYYFDMVSGKWSKAGEWPLPFKGFAEYVPEYNLWFGVSAREDGRLCASDLGAASATQQPVVQEWEGFGAPEGIELRSYLHYLGSGQFCVTNLYKTTREDSCYHSCCHYETTVDMLVMFTGVKIQRCGRELQVVKHKSFRYSMGAGNMPQILC